MAETAAGAAADEGRALAALAHQLVGQQADRWDLAGAIPEEVVRKLADAGVLGAEIPARYGGPGLDSITGGELTAAVGSLCSSVRSLMTSQGMAAWTLQRLADRRQRATFLGRLAAGEVAAVAFSEAGAGSDPAAMRTRLRREGDDVVVDGQKVWITAAAYADLVIVFGCLDGGGAAVVVPTSAPGVHVRRVADPMGCRAAGHADIELDGVRLPAENLLGDGGASIEMLVTHALAYGRISVAWGCVGILRSCLEQVRRHARERSQFGKPIGEHQLVARQIAELMVDEQAATRMCEHASRCWDRRSPELVTATVAAKYLSARQAAEGSTRAVQVLASAGARDGHAVARAFRDAKLMEIIEGSNELCQLMLADHVLAGSGPER